MVRTAQNNDTRVYLSQTTEDREFLVGHPHFYFVGLHRAVGDGNQLCGGGSIDELL